MNKDSIMFILPSAVTLLRLLTAPAFYYVFHHHASIYALVIIIFAALTDAFDGFLARKFNATSNIGAFFDVTTDFIVIATAFVAFIQNGWYDVFVILLILFMFTGFIVSSGLKQPHYDPVGKHLGTFLMAMIIITLVFPYPIVRKGLTHSLTLFCILSIISRTVIMYKHDFKRSM